LRKKKEVAGRVKSKTVLITSGATREFIDDVRFISNPSSGKTGYFLSQEASKRGYNVIFVTGKSSYVPQCGEIIRVTSAQDMYLQVMKHYKKADVVIGAAAVGDFTVKKAAGKIERKEGLSLTLNPTKDIMAALGKKPGKRLLVGYAAESGPGIKRAIEKMKKKNLWLMVFNDISKKGAGFDSDNNEISVINRKGKIVFKGKGSKKELAASVFDAIEGSGE
jgi:phosphopantothenoylcysteine decarboxylase / phosphopantothenate---cysteine ligase